MYDSIDEQLQCSLYETIAITVVIKHININVMPGVPVMHHSTVEMMTSNVPIYNRLQALTVP